MKIIKKIMFKYIFVNKVEKGKKGNNNYTVKINITTH